jgi:hypothetical protein
MLTAPLLSTGSPVLSLGVLVCFLSARLLSRQDEVCKRSVHRGLRGEPAFDSTQIRFIGWLRVRRAGRAGRRGVEVRRAAKRETQPAGHFLPFRPNLSRRRGAPIPLARPHTARARELMIAARPPGQLLAKGAARAGPLLPPAGRMGGGRGGSHGSAAPAREVGQGGGSAAPAWRHTNRHQAGHRVKRDAQGSSATAPARPPSPSMSPLRPWASPSTPSERQQRPPHVPTRSRSLVPSPLVVERAHGHMGGVRFGLSQFARSALCLPHLSPRSLPRHQWRPGEPRGHSASRPRPP